ncbi:hypothetical protein FDN13_04190 [Caloramator sp. E03]|uniref:hypothetical protein n=1 Tax=Caloramator sp. E03 TaxID=2576307 RepID=UPI001110506D|nr:hypothetical protein [Caloramator sp. E03]QCX32971.1 hypothetical protein FDN13_04190 [Caloramator sp. E03]
MYGKYVEGAVAITNTKASPETKNRTANKSTGKNISSWINHDDLSNFSFILANAFAYRTAGPCKAAPDFDVIDYRQEDYVFGDRETDARHP